MCCVDGSVYAVCACSLKLFYGYSFKIQESSDAVSCIWYSDTCTCDTVWCIGDTVRDTGSITNTPHGDINTGIIRILNAQYSTRSNRYDDFLIRKIIYKTNFKLF
jgi:hypothetical protein